MNIFQTKIKKPYVYLIIENKNTQHFYDYNSAVGVFETDKAFEEFCINDVLEFSAEYSAIPFCHNTIIKKTIKINGDEKNE